MTATTKGANAPNPAAIDNVSHAMLTCAGVTTLNGPGGVKGPWSATMDGTSMSFTDMGITVPERVKVMVVTTETIGSVRMAGGAATATSRPIMACEYSEAIQYDEAIAREFYGVSGTPFHVTFLG
jgi:hypothetical protein